MRQQKAIFIGILFSVFGLAECFPTFAAPTIFSSQHGPLNAEATLVQRKVLLGGPGEINLALTLHADEEEPVPSMAERPASDLVVVIDRSGSMSGSKIEAARLAIAELIQRLGARDRFALVSYANGVSRHTELRSMNRFNRQAATEILYGITTGGGTNLGGGLQSGIHLLRQQIQPGRRGRVLLISDGLANQGITDPYRLGEMAAAATEDRVAVTTIGVGLEFNEHLLSLLADRGAGRYYYLEHPNDFAAIFAREWGYLQATAVSGIQVSVELPSRIRLVSASGYLVALGHGVATFSPGDLLNGQQRTFYLTFEVPTDVARTIPLGRLRIQFQHQGHPRTLFFDEGLEIACSADAEAVRAAIDKERWFDKVIQEDVNQLKESVAADIKAGRREGALKKIRGFKTKVDAENKSVGSAEVGKAVEETAQTLEAEVTGAFAGPPAVSALEA
jgi:Ca-activated chloride channel homolog